MATTLPKLELEKVFQADADELFQARSKGGVHHHSKDIRTAGDEVEEAVRTVLRRRLPTQYHVGHGHILDQTLRTSPQLDVVIADRARSPLFLGSANGTEYFSFESVYCFGGIKSTYYKAKSPLQEFMASLGAIKETLHREATPKTYVTHGLTLGSGFALEGSHEPRNPLFTFMVFVASHDLALEDLTPLLRDSPRVSLPNLMCFLDRGVVVNAAFKNGGSDPSELAGINVRADTRASQPAVTDRWALLEFDGANAPGVTLGFLFFVLMQHLQSTLLMPTNVLAYLNGLFKYRGRLIT